VLNMSHVFHGCGVCRSGGRRTVRILWHHRQPDDLSHRPARPVDGGRRVGRQRVARCGHAVAAARLSRRRLLAWPLPHRHLRINPLHLGTTPKHRYLHCLSMLIFL
jgi:hypothetical protein